MKPFQPGQSVGPYQLISPLGAGGMGEVWKARDTRLDRIVALKFARAAFSDRGRREAQTIAALNHPNIATLYDVGPDYLVMEYVEGAPLRPTDDLRKLIDLAAQIADGLAAAHAAGTVHRDLKPANIMVTNSGRVKILDFGLARRQAAGADATAALTITQPGTVVGTVAYMSPEQARGQELDARSDQFSFGLILYELATGRRAFAGETAPELMAAIIREPAEPLPDSIPAPLQWIIERCLSKDPEGRYCSTRDLHLELRNLHARFSGAFERSKQLPAAAPGLTRKRRAAPLLASAAALVAFVALLFFALRRDELDIAAHRYTPFAMDQRFQGYPAWSPDGKLIAYSGEVDGALQIFKRGLGSAAGDQLSHAASDCLLPFWSPDGARIFYIHQQQLWTVGAGGGEPEMVYRNVLAAAISPDGRTLALARPDIAGEGGLWMASPPGAEPVRHARFDRVFIDADVHFSPDGAKLAISMITGERSPEFWVLPLPNGAPRELKFLANLARWHPFSWMPDSKQVLVGVWLSMSRRGQLWMADTDRDRIRAISISTAAPRDPAVSPDGRSVAFTNDDSDSDIVELPLTGGPPKPVIATPASESAGVWQPSGEGLLYVTDRDGIDEIWIRSHGTDRPVVTEREFPSGHTFYLSTPSFSPDGRRIAFTRRVRGGFGSIWISPVVGGLAVRLMAEDSPHGAPSWSPDGSWIAHTIAAGGRASLAKTRVGGSGGSVILKENLILGAAPQWAPDGRWITFGTAGQFGIVSPDGTQTRLLANETWLSHRWSKDGKGIYGVRLEEGRSLMSYLNIETGERRTLFPMSRQAGMSSTRRVVFTLSPDEKSILLTHHNRKGEIWLLEDFGRRLGLFDTPWRSQVPD